LQVDIDAGRNAGKVCATPRPVQRATSRHTCSETRPPRPWYRPPVRKTRVWPSGSSGRPTLCSRYL